MFKTNQEIYNEVAEHLLKQNARSMVTLPDDAACTCAYRGDNNLMCAAGKLIKDEFYRPDMENMVADDFEVSQALIRSGVNMENPETNNLVGELQNIHDNTALRNWRNRLEELAIANSLIPVA